MPEEPAAVPFIIPVRPGPVNGGPAVVYWKQTPKEVLCAMRCYQLSAPPRVLPAAPPAPWRRVLAVLSPEECAAAPLPAGLRPPAPPDRTHSLRYCRVGFEADQVHGAFHIPARQGRPAHSFSFTWWAENLLFVDPDGFFTRCLEAVCHMRPHQEGGAGDFLVDLLTLLIQEELPYIQQLEERAAGLEQEVLADRTRGFIPAMSALRQELNRFARYYAQLDDMANALLENAADLLGQEGAARLGCFARRVESLQAETQMLREYASQIASEYQAQIDIGQNRIMKILTIVTTLCLPLSLIAGWYGMNFTGMPELQWAYGYPAVILLSIGVLGLCLWYFRKKHFW